MSCDTTCKTIVADAGVNVPEIDCKAVLDAMEAGEPMPIIIDIPPEAERIGLAYRSVPADSLLDFALFVTFFPQLVAGPIERAANLLPQFEKSTSNNVNHLQVVNHVGRLFFLLSHSVFSTRLIELFILGSPGECAFLNVHPFVL